MGVGVGAEGRRGDEGRGTAVEGLPRHVGWADDPRRRHLSAVAPREAVRVVRLGGFPGRMVVGVRMLLDSVRIHICKHESFIILVSPLESCKLTSNLRILHQKNT